MLDSLISRYIFCSRIAGINGISDCSAIIVFGLNIFLLIIEFHRSVLRFSAYESISASDSGSMKPGLSLIRNHL
jgi:hypothetical protein